MPNQGPSTPVGNYDGKIMPKFGAGRIGNVRLKGGKSIADLLKKPQTYIIRYVRIIMTKFLLPIAINIIDKAVDKIPEDLEGKILSLIHI